MDQPRQSEQSILQQALALPVEQRAAYLDQVCGVDEQLRQRLEARLGAEAFPRSPEEESTLTAPKKTIHLNLAAAEKPGQTIGRYKLLEKIGEGGFGVVYVAEQKEPVRRRVALKIIKLGMDTRQVIARLEAERQALALMDHPNIAKVLDAGATETGRPYFVMELVRGIHLTDYCDQNKVPTRQRLELFIQVCRAVQHAHQKGIIHRDLKPSNILVTLHDGVPVPKVIDFGIAKATQGQLTDKTVYTEFQQFIGTPAYMSPEQAELSGLDIDTRSDIYSLGVLLYELLTGKTPFDAKALFAAGLDEIRRIIRDVEPLRPSQKLSTLSPEEQTSTAKCRQTDSPRLIHLVRGDLDWIVMQCLEKDRNRRYETANGVAVDVQRHLDNEPVVARPPSRLYQFLKLVQRNRAAVAAAGGIVLSLVLGLVASTWLYWRETEAHNKAAALASEQTRLRVEAQTARRLAEQRAREVTLTLAASDFSRAVGLISQDRDGLALAYLASSLRLSPTNSGAATALASLLANHSWKLPRLQLKLEGGVSFAHFSSTGDLIVSASRASARLWDARTGYESEEALAHDGSRVSSAQFSPDGHQLLTVSADGAARVWNLQTKQLLAGPFRDSGVILSGQFSPDGSRVLTASKDGTVRVWDSFRGQSLIEPLKPGGKLIVAQFGPARHQILTASEDGTACVWDAQTRQRVLTMRHGAAVAWAEASSDGSRIVTVSNEGMARVWDGHDGSLQAGPIRLVGDDQFFWAVRRAHFSPDGKRFVTLWGTARVWDALSGRPLTPELRHGSALRSVQFSPDGSRLVTASEDHTARVWDAHTGQPLTEPLNHTGIVTWAEFDRTGKEVLTASLDGTVCVWNVQPSKALALPLKLTDQALLGKFSPDGKKVLTASANGELRIWDAMTGKLLAGPLQHAGPIWWAQFSPDGQSILTASGDSTARVWDVQSGRARTGPLRHTNSLSHADFSPNGKWVATASWDNTARIWDAQTGQPLTSSLQHAGPVRFVEFSPDGAKVVTASHDGTACVWDAKTGQRLLGPLRHRSSLISARFSPDGEQIVTACCDNTARLWNVRTGQLVARPLEHGGIVGVVMFSSDGKLILTASADGTARVWDAATGLPVSEPLWHSAELGAEFSPCGERVLTFSNDRTARIWDARTGEPLTDPLVYDGAVVFGTFSPDGNRVITVSGRTAHLWDIAPPGPAPDWLRLLAEAFSGEVIGPQGVAEKSKADGRTLVRQVEQTLRQTPPSDEGWVAWGRWLLSDPATRTISPFTKTTVRDNLAETSNENTVGD